MFKVKYLLKSDSEALSVKWEVVSETEVQNNRKIKEEPFMQGEMHNDLKQNIGIIKSFIIFNLHICSLNTIY